MNRFEHLQDGLHLAAVKVVDIKNNAIDRRGGSFFFVGRAPVAVRLGDEIGEPFEIPAHQGQETQLFSIVVGARPVLDELIEQQGAGNLA